MQINTLATYLVAMLLKHTSKTSETYTYNMPLKQLLLQHPYETNAIYI
jgi:hypothetical protein